MGWNRVGKGEGAGDALPFLKVERPTLIRFIGTTIVPELEGTKYGEGPAQKWQHWAPDDLAEKIGGARGIQCCGVRDGCIFHQEPLKWRAGKQNIANVVVYEDFDVKKRTYTAKKIMVFQGGVMVFQQIRDQAEAVGRLDDIDAVYWLISKTGKGKDTSWTATMIVEDDKKPIDKDFDIMEFDEQPAYADANLPMLIDYDEFPGFEEQTPATQREWLDKLLTSSEATPEGTEAPATQGTTDAAPPGPPAGAPGTAAAPAAGRKITLAGKNAPGAATPPPPPAAKAPPPPPAPKGPSKAEVEAAVTLLESWNEGTSHNVEHLQYVIDTAGFSDDYKNAATLLLSLEGSKAPSPPPPPAASNGHAATGNVEELRARLTKAYKQSETLKNFQNMRKFLDGPGGGVKAIGKIEDPDLLLELIAMVEAGEDAIKEAIA